MIGEKKIIKVKRMTREKKKLDPKGKEMMRK